MEGRNGMEEEKIRELEEKEKSLMVQSIEAAKAGAVSPSLQKELAEVRAELKRLRRVATMKANRTEPVLDSTLSINVNKATRDKLEALAASRAMTLSEYMRFLIDEHIAAQAFDFSSGLRPHKNRGKVDLKP
jgi:macrodomain Ter protein organizer (MatP/YcbG family)